MQSFTGVFLMNVERCCWFWVSFAAGVLLTAASPLSAQAPFATPATAVLINLTTKPDSDRARVMNVMKEEIRAPVELYPGGKIQQWYSHRDGRGVVFVMNCSTV